jgi:hypothetical protein
MARIPAARPIEPLAMPSSSHPEGKPCVACGRWIDWRKKWERDWDNVKFCSDACRKKKPGPQDAQLEATILTLLASRARGSTICPSEAARAVATQHNLPDWQPLMEPTRAAARRLVAQGKVLITQAGREVDPSTAKGPIRIRKA